MKKLVHVADYLLLPRDHSLDQGEVARPASRCHSEFNVSNWSLQNGCGCGCTHWLIGRRLNHLNVDVWILGMSVEVLPPVVWVVVLALVIAIAIAIAIGIGIAVGPLAVAVARVEFLDFVGGVDIGPLDIGIVRIEVLAPVVGVEVLPLVIGVAVLVVPPIVCIGIGIGIAIAIARAVARFFVKASCKHGHSIELPKAGFRLVKRVQHLCFWLVSFPWRRLVLLNPCGYFCGMFGEELVFFLFLFFWSIVYWFCLSWDTSPQEAGNSLQVRRLKTTP